MAVKNVAVAVAVTAVAAVATAVNVAVAAVSAQDARAYEKPTPLGCAWRAIS